MTTQSLSATPTAPTPRLAFGQPGTLTLAAVIRRGWSRQGALQLLGEGERAPNPYGDSPLRLYAESDVLRSESHPDFARVGAGAALPAAPTGPSLKELRAQLRHATGAALTTEQLRALAEGRFTLDFADPREVHRLMHSRARAGRPTFKPVYVKNPQLTEQLLRMNAAWANLECTPTADDETLAAVRRARVMLLSALAAAHPRLMRACAALLVQHGRGHPDAQLFLMPGQDLPPALQAQLTAQGLGLSRSVSSAEVQSHWTAHADPRDEAHVTVRASADPTLAAALEAAPEWWNATQIKRLVRGRLPNDEVRRFLGQGVKLVPEVGDPLTLHGPQAVLELMERMGQR